MDTSVFRTILDNVSEGVYFVDSNRAITLWNKAAEDISGYKESEVKGRLCQDNLLSHMDRFGRSLCLDGCPLHATLHDGEERKAEVLLRHKEGHRVPMNVHIMPVYSKGVIVGALEIFAAQSPRRYEEGFVEALTSLAMKDPLTDLPNRTYLTNVLESKLLEHRRFGRQFCVAFVDIDNFTLFNNYFGHTVGDSILQSISGSFLRSLRGSDRIGRWGGEEFLGVFNVKGGQDPYIISERVRMLVACSGVTHNGSQLAVTASVGLTVVQPNDTVDSIVSRADSLMYKSKKRGKNCSTTDAPPPIDGIPETILFD